MADYREVLEKLARHGIAERMPSGTVEQEKAWLEVCFRHAQKQVCIYTEAVDSEALSHDGVLEELKRFLARPDAVLKVLVQARSERERRFIETIEPPDGNRGRIIVRHAKGSYGRSTAKRFAVMDETGYRFETDASRGLAVAAFNEPDTVRNLLERFNEAFDLAVANEIFPGPRDSSPASHGEGTPRSEKQLRGEESRGQNESHGHESYRSQSNAACGK